MKKALIIILLFLLVFIVSCKKNSSTTKTSTKIKPTTRLREDLWPSVENGHAMDFGFLNPNSKYLTGPFYSDNMDVVTYLCNALWEDFGIALNGKVYRLATTSSWQNICCVKTMWHKDIAARDTMKAGIRDYPQRGDGYIWSWNTSETWGGPGYGDKVEGFVQSYHFDQQFEFINAIKEILVWDANTSFLDEVDRTTAQTVDVPSMEGTANVYNYNDESYGKTVKQKLELAVNYMMEELNGKEGLIILDKYANTGDFDSSSSNIWDTLCFGYKDPYEGALYLGSLNSLIEIYKMTGELEKVEKYSSLLERAYEAYDETYWDNEKGRYVSTISKTGVTYDYGLTFLQFMALYHNAGNKEKANLIFDWIDGVRTIESDDAKGKEILGRWVISAMSNTKAIESESELVDGNRIAWWHAPNSISVFSNSKFKQNLENGGTIFYTAYYENMARIKNGMTEFALQRFMQIADEYAYDELDRDPPNNVGCSWLIGVIEEFPENGLVPLVYVKGFMGVNAYADGLHIEPNMPKDYINMGCKEIYYNDSILNVNIRAEEYITIETESQSKASNFVVSNFMNKSTYSATVEYSNGDTQEIELTKNNNGTYSLNVNEGFKKIKIK